MSTLFVLLGLIFLGGGVASIIDGYPYMVLERGFTQVIVGSVAVAAGVLLLALSRVMAELKQLRQTLSNAVMAVSVASLAAEMPGPAISRAGDRDGASADATGPGAGLSGAAAGVVVGAGASAIVGRMLMRDEPRHEPPTLSEPAPATASFERALAATASPGDDADLFLKADVDRADAESDRPEMPGPDRRNDAFPAAALTDLDPPGEKADEPFLAEFASMAPADDIRDPFSQALLAPAAPVVDPGEAVDPPGKSEPDFDALLAWPEPEPYKPMAAAPRSEPRDDAFASLRDDLAHRSGDRNQAAGIPAQDDGRRQGGEIEAAESWMDRPVGRREPWFAEPSVQSSSADADEDADEIAPVVAEATLPPDLQLPPWPTSKRGSAARDPAIVREWPTLESDTERNAPTGEAAPEARYGPVPADETAPELPEPEQEGIAEIAAPAASNEGVVGAYQVGDANFTIYADGSIKARTPDGDYNFGSMDELKTYLASEKSRLGG